MWHGHETLVIQLRPTIAKNQKLRKANPRFARKFRIGF
jgi:hypothetical protein